MTFEVASFVGSFFSRGWLLFTAVKFYRYFWRIAISEGRYFWNTLRDKPRERLRKR